MTEKRPVTFRYIETERYIVGVPISSMATVLCSTDDFAESALINAVSESELV